MTYYFDRISYVDGVTKTKNKSFRKGKRYRNDEPYLCPKCKKVWQPLRTYRDRSDYLLRFPKIGCTKRKCYNCINERKEKWDK